MGRLKFIFVIFSCSLIIIYALYSRINAKYKHRKALKNRSREHKTGVVILLTMMRSGSSIVGSIFNERVNVTYLYEPLFPFSNRGCDESTRRISLEALKQISRCQFEKLQPLYNTSTRRDRFAKCKTHNLCFADFESKALRFLSRDAGICGYQNGNNICPKPIPFALLNKFCQRSLLVAMKVIYLCELKWLMPLLSDPTINMKIVHLVRDPRSTIYSRSKHNGSINFLIRKHTKKVCGRLSTNLMFLDKIDKDSKFWDQYMRIRYEDFALNPFGVALKIYKFVGLSMTMNVKEWLDNATSVTNKDSLAKTLPQGLKRNIKSVLNNWRKDLSFETVQEIQRKCDKILEKLDYKIFNNNNELKDVSTSYFTPHW